MSPFSITLMLSHLEIILKNGCSFMSLSFQMKYIIARANYNRQMEGKLFCNKNIQLKGTRFKTVNWSEI